MIALMHQTKRPLLDEIFSAVINNDFSRLDELSEERAKEAAFLRSVFSTAHQGGAVLDLDLQSILRNAPWMVSLLEGPRFMFLSAQTAIQSRLTGGKSWPIIDWSFSFDSNVAERVRGFFNHEDIDLADRDRVIALLRLKRKHNIQIDFVPFLFENLRLARENPQNQRPVKTIAAFKAIDYLNWEEFEKNPGRPQFHRAPTALLKEAENLFDEFLLSDEIRKREDRALFAQALLLKMTEEWLNNHDPLECKFGRLIDFCIFKLGQLPVYELQLALQFLREPKFLRFFGPIADLSKDILAKIRSMAWDMSHVRTLEMLATSSRMGGFYLPFFVSFDDKLVELIRANPIQFILFDDKNRSVLSGREVERDFQVVLNACMSEEARNANAPVEVERRRGQPLDRSRLNAHIIELETNVKFIADLKRNARGGRN